MAILAIGFDYGGVLKGDPSATFLRDICALLHITPEQYITSYYKFNKPVQRGEMSWDDLWRLFLDDIGQPEQLQKVVAMFKAAEPKQLNQKMIHLVKTLKINGYRVGLLSNHTKEMAQTMRHEGLEDLFDCFHVSSETGFVKPEPTAFTHLADALGVAVDEMVFIDDSKKSLSTSKQVGYIPILFVGYDDLLPRLTQLGITIT